MYFLDFKLDKVSEVRWCPGTTPSLRTGSKSSELSCVARPWLLAHSSHPQK